MSSAVVDPWAWHDPEDAAVGECSCDGCLDAEDAPAVDRVSRARERVLERIETVAPLRRAGKSWSRIEVETGIAAPWRYESLAVYEEIAEKQRAYYEANREEIAEKKRAYREAKKQRAAGRTAVSS